MEQRSESVLSRPMPRQADSATNIFLISLPEYLWPATMRTNIHSCSVQPGWSRRLFREEASSRSTEFFLSVRHIWHLKENVRSTEPYRLRNLLPKSTRNTVILLFRVLSRCLRYILNPWCLISAEKITACPLLLMSVWTSKTSHRS